MEGSPHKHKRTIAQDFLTKSLSQSIELNLSLNRYSFTTEHSGPLTLRVTHQSGPEEAPSPDKMKKSSIQERPAARTISNLRNNLLQLEEKLSLAHRQLNSPPPPPPPSSSPQKRSTVGTKPCQFQKMLDLFICNEVSQDESTINLESHKLLAVKSRDKLTLSNQLSKYYTGHLIRALMNGPSAPAAHLSAAIAAMKKAMIIRMPSQIEIQNKRITLNCPPQQGRKTLLLELQLTLLCIRKRQQEQNDLVIGSGNNKFYVALRPYLFSFLKKMKQYFQLVIYTTLEAGIAKQILQDIDPDSRLISDCLSKEHCLLLKQILCKDIRIINRSVKEICLIDANPESAMLHPENYIPILPYRGGEDRQLMQLQKLLLKEMVGGKDIRECVRERFKMNRYWQYENWEMLVRELYLD